MNKSNDFHFSFFLNQAISARTYMTGVQCFINGVFEHVEDQKIYSQAQAS